MQAPFLIETTFTKVMSFEYNVGVNQRRRRKPFFFFLRPSVA
jgi:hypothetical protein